MLNISMPENGCFSGTEQDDVCYTDLTPPLTVLDMASLITSATDPCLAVFPDEGYSVEYVVHTEETMSDFPPSCAVYNLPDSPQSLCEEECPLTEQDLLQTRLYEDSQVYDDEDDDASVMLDLMDLSFLDQPDAACSEELDYGHCFTDTLDTCPTVVVRETRGGASEFYHQFTPSQSPSTPSPSPSSSPPSLPSPTNGIATTDISTILIPSSSSSTTTLTLHYYDHPANITILDSPSSTRDDDSLPLSPASISDSIRSMLAERVSGGRKGPQQQQQRQQQEEEIPSDDGTTMDFETFDNSDNDNDDFKPYCGSRRGAKKNLLWKFLLWTLDHHSDVLSWTDVHKGVFTFVDTGRVSSLWGQRKKKQNMTFEKLSRGIRHYYKLGLMERLPHRRLMYKFNWDKVPKKYRKA